MGYINNARKWRKAGPEWWKFSGIIFMVAPIVFLYYASKSIIKSWDSPYTLILLALFLSVFFFIWLKMFIKSLKTDKAKNLKKTWNWIIKKLKISSFKECRLNNKGLHHEILIRIEAKDGDKIYYSEPMHLAWIDEDFFENVYLNCGYTYDENETHKNEVIEVLESRIIEAKNKANNSILIWKWYNNRKAKATNYTKEIISKWYEPKHLEIWWKKIDIWDIVDVYIDPHDESIYWMDTE